MFLVGNKSDLEERRRVSYDEGYQFSSGLKIQFFETSAKSAKGVRQMFDSVAASVLRNGNIKIGGNNSSNDLKKILNKKESQNNTGCCT